MYNRFIRWVSIFALLFGASIAPAISAPSVQAVSGDVAHGGDLTITGSAFGQKSPAKPYLWAPFDGSGNPSSLGIVTSWSQVQSMTYAPGEGMSGSGAFKASNGSGTWTARVDASGFAWNDYGHKMYLYRRVKRNFNVTDSMNWKIIRVWPSSSSYPNWHIGTHNARLYVEGIGAGSWILNNNLARGTANVWRIDEFITQANSNAGASDGIFQYLVNGATVESLPRSGTDNWKVRENSANGSASMNQIYPIHGVMANFNMPSDYRYWVDDVYLDTTWARVVVGNASTLSASTHREIQIPTAWSATSITVVANLQSFPANQTPYLFVVDAAGNASQGIPLDRSPPEPPGGVRVD